MLSTTPVPRKSNSGLQLRDFGVEISRSVLGPKWLFTMELQGRKFRALHTFLTWTGKNGAGSITTKNQPISHRFRLKYEYQRADHSSIFHHHSLEPVERPKKHRNDHKGSNEALSKAVKAWDAICEALMDYEMQRMESIFRFIESCS